MRSRKTLDELRSLADIFKPSSFRRVAFNLNVDRTLRRIEHHKLGFRGKTIGAVLKGYYKVLEECYRNEYVFKNALLRQELLEQHALSTTTVLNEFRIGSSVADFILINGEIRLFEIKTDLDDFDKLEKQIADYRLFANKIYVVASRRNAERLLKRFRKSPIGLVEFDAEKRMTTIKDAETDNSSLSHVALFKSLRQSEYLSILSELHGSIPSVPNTKLFRESLNRVSSIPVDHFQDMVRDALKMRHLQCPDLLRSAKTPEELKHVCYTLDLSATQYDNLFSFLKLPI